MARKLLNLRHVTIIGAGLLGGSAALAIQRACRGVHIAGVGRRQKSLDQALTVGAIDSAHLEAATPAARSDLVILATPVGAFGKYLQQIAPHLKRGVLVTDVGSTKATVVRTAEAILGRGGPFVGSHPMAGSERKGARFARADLFAGATCIVTPTASTPAALVRRVERFWHALGARTVRMAPAAHDRAMAAVSHLPHALAALLALLPPRAALAVAGQGLADMTRLAGGDVEVWRDIFLTNRAAMLSVIDEFDEQLMALRDLMELGDGDRLLRLLASAKKRRDGLIAHRCDERRMKKPKSR
ncbi:MAG: prephenate dehydrogenase [Phycisphaerae bacterium]|nr:prephenate dehydrogenase [Phycisphaerae bacterium]